MQKLNETSFSLTHLLFILALYAFVMFFTSSWWGVIETSEARYAEISREMFLSSDYLHTQLLNIQHYHKPPVTYWITSLSYSLFGVNSFGVRFFLVIAYVLQCIIVYHIAFLIFQEEQKSFWSAFIYSNLLLVLISVRALTTDAYNNLFILLTIWMALKYKSSRSVHWIYATAVSTGLAFLTKGPVVLMMLLPAYLFIDVKKEKSQAESHILHHVIGLIVFSAIGSSWYLYLVSKNEIFFDYFITRHLVDRFVHAEIFMRQQPWYFYLIIFPTLSLPWFIPFILNIQKISLEGKKVLTGWFLLPLIIFSLASSKLVLYILPLAAGFSLVTADVLWFSDKNQKLIFLVTYLLLLVGFFTIPFFDAHIVLPYSSKIILSIAILLSLSIFFFLNQQQPAVVFFTSIFTITILLFSALLIKENALKFNSIKPITDFIKQQKLETRTPIVYNRLLPSLSFELGKSIISLGDTHHSLQREVQFETNLKWKDFLFDLNQVGDSIRFQKLIAQPSFLITKDDLAKKRAWIVQKYPNQKRFANWTIYY
jgi:hypothetical protein